MTEKRETYAYLWIEADVLPHEEISKTLGLEPTRSWNKGDQGVHRAQRRARWEFRSPVSTNEIFLEAHLAAVVEALQNKSEEIASLKKKYELGINCVGYYTNANPGFHLDPYLLQ